MTITITHHTDPDEDIEYDEFRCKHVSLFVDSAANEYSLSGFLRDMTTADDLRCLRALLNHPDIVKHL